MDAYINLLNKDSREKNDILCNIFLLSFFSILLLIKMLWYTVV